VLPERQDVLSLLNSWKPKESWRSKELLNHRFTRDGLLFFLDKQNYSPQYIHVYKNGIIEAVDTLHMDTPSERNTVDATLLEGGWIKIVSAFFLIADALDVGTPASLSVALLGHIANGFAYTSFAYTDADWKKGPGELNALGDTCVLRAPIITVDELFCCHGGPFEACI
jgi:hypothetical protein